MKLYFDALHTWAGHGRRPRPTQMLDAGPARLHRPGRDAQRRLWPYPSRAMLGVLVLAGSCFLVACWNARIMPPGPARAAGIDLRVAAVSPKVNTTSAEQPPLSPTVAVVQPEQEKSTVQPPPLLPPLPTPERRPEMVVPVKQEVVAPPVVEAKPQPVAEVITPPLADAATATVSAVYYGPGSLTCSCFGEMLRGDTPMMRTWTLLKLSSVMAVALAAAPAAAGPTELGQDNVEKLKKIEEKLDSLLLMSGDSKADMKDLKERLKKLNDIIDATTVNLSSAISRLELLEKRVNDMRLEIDKIQSGSGYKSLYLPEKAAIDDLKARLDAIAMMIAKGPPQPVVAAKVANLGRIQLANMYSEEMLFVINGKGYRVAPFTTVMLENQPAGVFSYEVISGTYGVRGRNSPLLVAGDTYTITVR